MGSDLDRLTGAYTPQFKYHDENLLMLSWYARRLVDRLKHREVRSLLSLGLGHQVVSRLFLEELVPTLERYVVVEGSARAIEDFARGPALPANVQVVHSFFEEFEGGELFDAVEAGFVLEHVDDPLLVLQRFRPLLRPSGLLAVVVPNARALHRVVGHHAGLLPDLEALSPHDRELGHQRYFDLASVSAVVERAGFSITRKEGVFLKCLTTDQLRSLNLDPEVLRAFCAVGVEYPEISNAIYLEARP
jgi:SAM-dependent methyltransferase